MPKALALLLLLSVAGCGPSTVSVSGTLLKGGKPFATNRGDIQVIFVPVEDKVRQTYPAKVDNHKGSGRFFVTSLPRGEYRIAVEVIKANDKDLLGGAFGQDNSPLVYDLQEDQDLEIELSRR